MIKGCRKRMVIVSGFKDSSIEAAYFVMKDDREAQNMTDDDIIKKANSIVESCSSDTVKFNVFNEKNRERSNARHEKISFISFIVGLVSGGTLFCIIALFATLMKK